MKKRAQKQAPTIVLAMMVRNERHIIRRAIESALPVISSYLIVDTGSTDDTVKLATEALEGKPGEIVTRPWVNHAHNRSELIALAKERGDWLLLLDADEVFEVGGPMPDLAADAADGYEVPELEGPLASSRLALVRASRPWSYVGELREVLTCEEQHKIEPCSWGRIVHYEDGAEAHGDQYERRMQEAEAFRGVLDQNPHDARAAFYVAESLRLAGDLAGAIEAYEYRAALGGRDDETFWALFQIAKLHDRRARLADGYDPMRAAVVAGMYLRAYSFRPTRAEPLVALSEHFGHRGDWQTALMFAEAACSLPCVKEGHHPDRFSVDVSVIDWRARDMLALCCLSIGEMARAVETWTELETRLPEDAKEQVRRNLDAALKRSPPGRGASVDVTSSKGARPSTSRGRRADDAGRARHKQNTSSAA